MLKNRETYEIMTPQSIGRSPRTSSSASIPAATPCAPALRNWATVWTTSRSTVVFAAVKDLADKKANVHDEDLEALVFSEVYRLPIAAIATAWATCPCRRR